MFSKFTPLLCAILLLYQSLTAQTCTSIKNDNWTKTGTWSCIGATNYPTNAWAGGQKIVINSQVTIPNNEIIDLSSSDIDSLIIKSNAELKFGSNAKLILPAGTKIVLEKDGIISANNNSAGTLIEIGGNGVWGKSCTAEGCTNEELKGSGFLDEGGITLPVELLYFKGKASEAGVELEWATASEKNFDYFSIERSSDAHSFSPITEIKGQGESTEPVYYDYTDKHVVSGLMYYRLKAVDFDGSTEYFNVIAVYVPPAKHSIQIYPNPVQEKKFTIEINMESSEQVDMLLKDLSGKTLFQQKLKQGLNEVKLKSKLKSGVYAVVVKNGQMSHSQLLMLE